MHSLIIILSGISSVAGDVDNLRQNAVIPSIQTQSCKWNEGEGKEKILQNCKKLAEYLAETEGLVRKNYNEANALSVKCVEAAREFDRKMGGVASDNFEKLFEDFEDRVGATGATVAGNSDAEIKPARNCKSVSEKPLVKEITDFLAESYPTGQIELKDSGKFDFQSIDSLATLKEGIGAAISAYGESQEVPTQLWIARSMADSLDDWLGAFADYQSAKTLAEHSRANFVIDYNRFAGAVLKTKSLALKGAGTGLANIGTASDGEALTAENCALPSKELKEAKALNSNTLLENLNECARVLRLAAAAEAGRSLKEVPSSLTGGEISAALATGISGTNLELVFKNEFVRTTKWYEGHIGGEKKAVRRPSTWGFSAGVEASAEDGVASLFASGNDANNIFGLKRLNASIALKGSIGYNFYPEQSADAFNKDASDFLKKARTACEKSLAAGGKRINTSCENDKLLTWLYEAKDGAYSRSDLLQEYTKLL